MRKSISMFGCLLALFIATLLSYAPQWDRVVGWPSPGIPARVTISPASWGNPRLDLSLGFNEMGGMEASYIFGAIIPATLLTVLFYVDQVRIEKERRLERSDSKTIITPFYITLTITYNLRLVVSLIAEPLDTHGCPRWLPWDQAARFAPRIQHGLLPPWRYRARNWPHGPPSEFGTNTTKSNAHKGEVD